MFSKNRGTALFLMLIWILLSAGPVAYAATGKCCPACSDHLCPMKKQPKKTTMSCHESMAQESCQLRAAACSRELDGLVFSFVAIIQTTVSLSQQHVTPFISGASQHLILAGNQIDTPPPKFCFA